MGGVGAPPYRPLLNPDSCKIARLESGPYRGSRQKPCTGPVFWGPPQNGPFWAPLGPRHASALRRSRRGYDGHRARPCPPHLDALHHAPRSRFLRLGRMEAPPWLRPGPSGGPSPLMWRGVPTRRGGPGPPRRSGAAHRVFEVSWEAFSRVPERAFLGPFWVPRGPAPEEVCMAPDIQGGVEPACPLR